jgi:hypothetical protein
VKIRSLRFEFDILKNRRRKSVMGCASRIKQGCDRLPFGSRTKIDEEAILVWMQFLNLTVIHLAW